MHIIESWGTGIPRLYNRSAEYGLPEPLFEEFGDGIKVTMFRKVSSSAQKVGSVDEKVSSTFDKYVSMLKNAGITDKFIESIETVFHACDTSVVFGQVNVQEGLECSKSKATNVMKAMKTAKIIKKVPGAGFGMLEAEQLNESILAKIGNAIAWIFTPLG